MKEYGEPIHFFEKPNSNKLEEHYRKRGGFYIEYKHDPKTGDLIPVWRQFQTPNQAAEKLK